MEVGERSNRKGQIASVEELQDEVKPHEAEDFWPKLRHTGYMRMHISQLEC